MSPAPRTPLILVVAIAAVLLLLPAGASADVTIDFDDLPPETTVTDQYANAGGPGQGVVFGPLAGAAGNGFRPVVKSAPGQAQSGTNVADISVCNIGGCFEFYPPVTTGRFQVARAQVSARVGVDGAPVPDCSDYTRCADVTLQAYDANGNPVGEPSTKTVRRGDGYHTLLSASTPTRLIHGFKISARSDLDANEPVRIDDVTFDSPSGPVQPDFTLAPASTVLSLKQGGEVRVPIAIQRTPGSSGGIDFEASGALPKGVSARFEPDPAEANSTELVLTADPDAHATASTPATFSVTGRPTQESAGSQPRTFSLIVQVSGTCAISPDLSHLEGSGRVRYCRSASELTRLVRSGYTGRIVLANHGVFDFTGTRDIELPSGIELIGERGPLGSRPLVYDTNFEDHTLFRVRGGDARIEGIHFRGPTWDGEGDDRYRNAIQVLENPQDKPRNVVIADNEFERWAPGTGVEVRGVVDCVLPTDECPEPRMRPGDARTVRIERNYFHHAKRGYGVGVYGSAYATIEGNVSDYMRHLVASDGHAWNGYVARYNYTLEAGFTYPGGGRTSHFDVHGTGTPEERAQGHYNGGFAGEYYEIAHNTIRGAQRYGSGKTRPAFGLRGKTFRLSHFHDNITVHESFGRAVNLSGGKDKSLDSDRPSTFNFRARNNHFDTDYSKEIATGDFDGDGRTDVFLANGTGWFYSSGGVRPWSFLRPSEQRVHELGFADIDNDRTTDVLYRDSRGRIVAIKSGRAEEPKTLTSAPVAMKELRFGDFDGDSRTDIFYTRGGQWRIWSGSSRQWTSAATSNQPLSKLLFGEFDDVPGTDVAAVLANRWAYSSGAQKGWATLNGKRADSFERAVAADFNGNGRTDIAFVEGTRWRYSPEGRGSLLTLRTGAPGSEKSQFGRFGSQPGAGAGAVAWSGNRLSIWSGLGGSVTQSPQNMR